jgi:4a-hydroxytetrahydrobiopterin dehydratase
MVGDVRPSRQQISATVDPLGWRLILGVIHTHVPVPSLVVAAQAAAVAIDSVGDAGARHLAVDLRADRAVLRLVDPDIGAVTGLDLELARQVSVALNGRGLASAPLLDDPVAMPQGLEIAIDALDIAAVRPFWKSITGYADAAGSFELGNALVDPLGSGPTIWFQQMDVPRPQRNRIHLDVDVPHEIARARVDAALAAGGVLVSAAAAPAFWVLADCEGNEACVCTWQGRD